MLLRRVDAIAAPAMVFAPPRMNQMASLLAGGVADFITFTAPFNYSGHPTITLPSGFNRDGLPMAFQLIGRLLGEPTLIRAGSCLRASARRLEVADPVGSSAS